MKYLQAKKTILVCTVLTIIYALTGHTSLCFAKKIEIKSNNGAYSLIIDGKPFLMKGVNYSPVPIGKGYDYKLPSDENKPWLVDGKLMSEIGINCIKIYSSGKEIGKLKDFISDMYEKFGIYTVVSDWLGLWAYPRANYSDEKFREATKERIIKMVSALKDEKGLLMWVLGNENNYTFSGQLGFWTSPEIEDLDSLLKKQNKRAEIYYSFINELTLEIKKIDKVHPVTLGNGEEQFLNIASKNCKDIDALSIIIYRGKKLGNILNIIKNSFDKPIFLSEFGCDSYDAFRNKENQEVQSEFIISQWENLFENTVISGNASGNALGGFIFEWNDEWWKHNEGYTDDWLIHNVEAGWSNGAYFYDNRVKDSFNMNEEWFGIVSLSEEIENGINKRVPKKAYHDLGDFFATLNKHTSN
ncbi:MAG: hypothetical protein KAS51_00325 [Candidatus Omnitrophica bacterium]|nr:hypothetical protein [Candidatus Omnitrophota bacterium]